MSQNSPIQMDFNLGKFADAVAGRLLSWKRDSITAAIWSRDFRVWSESHQPEITDRLGWLDLPEKMGEHVGEIQRIADQIRAEEIRYVVLLGMGGSSLAAEVFHGVFGKQPEYPELFVLDTTHPAEIKQIEGSLDLERTLFIVASKSGTTQETMALFRYFFQKLGERLPNPGCRFVAITDPQTPLAELARTNGFKHLFLTPPDVGGRYSALSHFGLVPAALVGIDIATLLERAARSAASCKPEVAVENNPGLYLGATLVELALKGCDKVTFVTDTAFEPFPDWIEQLIAESTGKDGKGIVPITHESLGEPAEYTQDRLLAGISLANATTNMLQEKLRHFSQARFPVFHLCLADGYDLGGHMFVWEFAIAVASAALGVNPFSQPDVQLAKDMARKAIAGGSFAMTIEDEINLPAATGIVKTALGQLLSSARPGDYFTIQAFLPRSDTILSHLQTLRQRVRNRFRLATALGFGPRFLHSSGQLHKGGPNTGIFLQLVDEPTVDLAIPQSTLTFGNLIRAQAIGDYLALKERSRRILRMNLGSDPVSSLQSLINAI